MKCLLDSLNQAIWEMMASQLIYAMDKLAVSLQFSRRRPEQIITGRDLVQILQEISELF